MSYGNVAWGGTTNNHLKTLEISQRWILKIIYGRNYTYPTNLLFIESDVLDVRQLLCYSALIKHHTIKKFINTTHEYHLRYQDKFSQIPKVDKTITQRSFYFLGPKLYSMLPPDLKILNSINLFKSRARRWIKTKGRQEIHSLIDLKNVFHNF